MWHDIETDVDYLNFEMLVDSVFSTIDEQYDDDPLSFGISGSWGTGKSSLAMQLQKKFVNRDEYVVCNFNAWLFQGFEDAKIALLRKVSDSIHSDDKVWKDKISRLINGIKTGRSIAKAVVNLIPGIHPIVKTINEKTDVVIDQIDDLFKVDVGSKVTDDIEEFRAEIENKLKENNKKLVVFIDDLDRCMPDVALETLEAMRLLLFVKRTIFIIAADKRLIEQAVMSRFNIGEESNLPGIATSYFDKLIETPVDIPAIGESEALIYIISLMAENYYRKKDRNSDVSKKVKELGLTKLLEDSWKEPITTELINRRMKISDNTLLKDCFEDGIIIDSLADVVPLLIKTKSVSGNLRLLKRFLHVHILSKQIAEKRCIPFEQKNNLILLTIERANNNLYTRLNRECISNNGKINKNAIKNDDKITEEEKKLIDKLQSDLRPYFYLSRIASSQILTHEDALVEIIYNEITSNPRIHISDSEKKEIDKLNTEQLEVLATKLILHATTNSYKAKYISQLLYIDKKIKSDKIISYFYNIPSDNIKPADRQLFKSKTVGSNDRYKSIVEKVNAKGEV